MQQVICTALDYLPYGDGLPGEEVGAAAGDGVAAVDAAGRLWVLWGGGGNGVIVGEGQPFGLQGRRARGRPGRSLRPDRHGRARSSCRGGVATNRCRSSDSDNEVDGRFARTDYLHLVPNRGENVAAGG